MADPLLPAPMAADIGQFAVMSTPGTRTDALMLSGV
jgi:hypothetical protein